MSMQLDNDLLRDLECPVCTEYMEPPITMCNNGHNICNKCKPRVESCPECRGELLSMRNITMEKIAERALYPCPNKEAGCIAVMTLQQRNQHLSECPTKGNQCPFASLSGVNCEWTGSLDKVKFHVKNNHSEKDETIENFGVLRMKLRNIDVDKHYIKAVFTFNKLFYFIWETKYNDFCFAALYIGPTSDDGKFYYTFKLKKHGEYLNMRAVCKSYLIGKDDVLQPGESIVLPYRTILTFIDEDCVLTCEVEIQQEGTFWQAASCLIGLNRNCSALNNLRNRNNNSNVALHEHYAIPLESLIDYPEEEV